jgi:subtilisin family serine protease
LYATKKWKVKIISLSIAFDFYHLDEGEKSILKRALDYAKGQGVVIFAAASNHGNRTRIAFPASERHSVICMNSSDGLGNASLFNPPPREGHHYNFSILGEWVRSTWLQDQRLGDSDYGREGGLFKRQSGTSQATSIAASVAALIFQFGRYYGMSYENRGKLESFDGLEKILWIMADRSRSRQGFYDIVPWKLLNPTRGPERIKDTMEAELDSIIL